MGDVRHLWPFARGFLAGLLAFVVVASVWAVAFTYFFELYFTLLSPPPTLLQRVVGGLIWAMVQGGIIVGSSFLAWFVSDGRRTAFWAIATFDAAATIGLVALAWLAAS